MLATVLELVSVPWKFEEEGGGRRVSEMCAFVCVMELRRCSVVDVVSADVVVHW